RGVHRVQKQQRRAHAAPVSKKGQGLANNLTSGMKARSSLLCPAEQVTGVGVIHVLRLEGREPKRCVGEDVLWELGSHHHLLFRNSFFRRETFNLPPRRPAERPRLARAAKTASAVVVTSLAGATRRATTRPRFVISTTRPCSASRTSA